MDVATFKRIDLNFENYLKKFIWNSTDEVGDYEFLDSLWSDILKSQ